MASSNPGNKPPTPTIVVSSPALSRVDVGQAVSVVARNLWSQIEARAALVMEIDAWGPAMGDDVLLQGLLQAITLAVLDGIPPDAPSQHMLQLRACVGANDTLVLEVRHEARDRRSHRDISANDLAVWDRSALLFGARAEALEEKPGSFGYRLVLSALT